MTCGNGPAECQKEYGFHYFGKYHNIEVEDDVTAFVEYENGATGVFVTSTADAPAPTALKLQETGAKLS